jgi:hypothetical protein
MNISIEIIMEDNSFVNKNIIVTNEQLILLKNNIFIEFNIPIEKQEWYLNGNILSDNFNNWIRGDYVLFINNDIIEIKFLINNNINNIFINKYITVKELKNILSIKDNIYIRNYLLEDNFIIDNFIIDKYPFIINNKLNCRML